MVPIYDYSGGEAIPLQLEQHADNMKGAWDLPPYKSPAFMDILARRGIGLAAFRQMPIYRQAVRRGKIVGDEWAGD
jgi:hypothetical protein